MIEKIMIHNYRLFDNFELEFNQGLNILVGDNGAGKSTLLEAVHLALTAKLNGRPLAFELTPYLFNSTLTSAYVAQLMAGNRPPPPEMIIDLFLNETADTTGILRGSNNLMHDDAVGIRVRAALSPEYAEEFANFVTEPASIKLIPAEYFAVEWLGFSGNGITFRSVPATASLIDAASIKLQNGTDFHLQSIIKEHLEKKERVELSRTYRNSRESFSETPSVVAVNTKLSGSKGDVTDRDLSLAIDISQRYTWESSLVAHLDGLPFQFVGNGEQNTLKILLALNRKAADAHIILIEEPENHLSYSTLNILISKIAEKCKDKQVLISTHSSFVLNKLGLDSLVLMTPGVGVRIKQLPNGTQDYFRKLSGYDTLRVVLAKKVVLVEGPSDELVFQRAYMDLHQGRMPIADGIDVINVRGLSFARFLDIAVLLKKQIRIVTDNDGKPHTEVEARYASYDAHPFVQLHVGQGMNRRTLEPQILGANSLAEINAVLGTVFATDDLLLEYMSANKTTSALRIFESTTAINMPGYIQNAAS